jgi:cyclic beta-1,2-glucan synthetase
MASATRMTGQPQSMEPIRSELFSTERLEQYAELLASEHDVTLEQGKPLISRVIENGRVLLRHYRATASAVQREQSIAPAAEWLVDNFYIVEEQLREIRDDLPVGFYRKLPKLASGPLQGYPRVYGVAWAYVAHTDSRFEPDILKLFVSAYQKVKPLTIGELWALAITLRIVLVENLRRIAEVIVGTADARQRANEVAENLLGGGPESVSPESRILGHFKEGTLERPFLVQLIQRLRDSGPQVGPVLTWLDRRLTEQGTNGDEIVRTEHQAQASLSVSVRNVITSMRLTSSYDWQKFFENVSLVDEVLRQSNNFAEMDFATRDYYRHAIEDISRSSKHSEIEVAKRAVECAKHARQTRRSTLHTFEQRYADPGYYLVSGGRSEFEHDLGVRIDWRRRLLRWYTRAAVPGYLITIALATVLTLALPLLRSNYLGTPWTVLVLFGLLAAIPASELAVAVVNYGVTNLLGPVILPRLDLRNGIPPELRTIVVVPTILTSVSAVKEQVHSLEVHYLANSDGDIWFALLTDWVDATSECVSSDDELLATAVDEISDLNKRYGPTPTGMQRFFLFHRKRTWNEAQQKWMGWERKRGKLHELNRLLRGTEDTTFLPVKCNLSPPPDGIRFVITLDTDTRLPRGAAARLVGTMGHPLNQPRYDPLESRVVDGYSIVQPRITPTLPVENEGSLFARIYSGPRGIDPYSHAVSDVYQDLFGEGSYTGKGIYDIDAFEGALAGKIPENSLLSHDLFEGVFARTALATDIEFFDEFPSHFEVAAARQHRWVRGDWQLLPWIFGGAWKWTGMSRARIPAIGRWKMVDNLRRSLFAPAVFLTLFAGWLLLPQTPWVWTRFILAVIAIPALLPFMMELYPEHPGIAKRTHLRAVAADLSIAASQIALTLTFLTFHAWLMLDAIAKTLWRLLFTHRNMLEWVTAAQAKRGVDLNILDTYRRMAGGLLLSAAAAVSLAHASRGTWMVGAPFFVVWMAAPAVARFISMPPKTTAKQPISDRDRETLRLIARETWHFFEKFVTPADHALPPDNFQEDPKPIVAHRTSPTNIGLYLLSTAAAHDFGWLGTVDMVERLEATLETMRQLTKYKGHLYNWYDTTDLRPLEPKYVSSVDSGNLAGHLLALSNACRELIHTPWTGTRAFAGIRDAVALLKMAVAELPDTRRTHSVTRKQLNLAIDALTPILGRTPQDPAELGEYLSELKVRAQTVADIAETLAHDHGESPDSNLHVSAEALRACIESHLRDAEIFVPTLSLNSKKTFELGAGADDPPYEWAFAEALIPTVPTLGGAANHFEARLDELSHQLQAVSEKPELQRQAILQLEEITTAIQRSATGAANLSRRLSRIAEKSLEIFYDMDFRFLFDGTRKLLSLGYRAADGQLDPNCYDLLASESRLASFVAIAKGDVPSLHWFQLGRPLTPVGRGSALISWSGSMFEYLMPSLVMRAPAGSLLSQTNALVVGRQMGYAEERHVPWGISECAYNLRDIDFTYQYSAFGVPGLGLKRGLSEDLVVAPYATALAAMVDPTAAVQNFDRIRAEGGRGNYGFYEALDYTASRVPEGKNVSIVRAYLAHHQGMSLVALTNVLNDGAMTARFHAEPIVQATELLLQERTPRQVLVARPRAEEVAAASQLRETASPAMRRFTSPHDPIPRTHLLSNGRYSVMVTSAGSGYSRWRDVAITRWREDPTRDSWGSFIYFRDNQTGDVWSAGYQPSCSEPDAYEASFCEDRVEILRQDGSLATSMEVVISSEDDAEVRRVSLTNLGSRVREIQVTTYAELSLALQETDEAHPAFSNLFVETEYVSNARALLATRRKRSSDETEVWAAHLSAVDGQFLEDAEYETDRARFLGRTRDVRDPISILDGCKLSNTVGSVLDPIFSLRQTLRIAPGSTARIVFSTLVAGSREQVLSLADKYRSAAAFERTAALAWTQAQVQLHYLGISTDEAHLFQRLANLVLYSDPSLRPSSEILTRTTLELPSLWRFGISGDLPFVLARIDEAEDVNLIRQLLRAREYWRMKGFCADVVIINERPMSYAQDLQTSLNDLVLGNSSRLPGEGDKGKVHGGIFLLRGDQIPAEIRSQLESFARVVLLSRRGTLSEQVARAYRETHKSIVKPRVQESKHPDVLNPPRDLKFYNGFGGFTTNGREYVIVLEDGLRTPTPWVNVIANPSFGFLASESGSGFTWSVNSHENPLTPWSNDPVSDPPGEAIYIRDDRTSEVWSPAALPIRDESATYVARHGQGYSRFQHGSRGILLDLLQFVPLEDSVKISRLTLTNRTAQSRRLSVTAYAEWVLGSSRSRSAPHVVTDVDPRTGALFARNVLNSEFARRVAFADLGGRQTSYTTDRTEFIGRNGTLAQPGALYRDDPLSGKNGASLDPCAALQVSFELRPGGSLEVLFFIGEAESPEQARELVTRYRTANIEAILQSVVQHWDTVLDTIQVQTPDESMNIMLNRWLLYQTLVCRLWARAGFYQVSGAFGFRDQLQDVLALSVAKPEIAREHILRAAGRQFLEGDVQHWWHAPSGRGVRTRISDDLLWLPYAVIQFLEITGDRSVLDEQIPFLEGDTLAEGQHESYFSPRISETRATVYEHCARAIDRSLSVGQHGLPLIGTGDWNDGMNRVGRQGQGESVWLAWFLHSILWEFAKIADTYGEQKRAETWRLHVFALKAAIEREGWDGEWYRRAYFDDGTPLGSASASECRIDSISQTWGIMTGAAEPTRAVRAMAALERHLVRQAEGLILLLTPPFDRSPSDPGYIKGYVPGIRENGGQYTHAAVWAVLACAALGRGDRATELFGMLNPINHSNSRASIQRYKVEPYVIAGDVYSEPPHAGRGGWTWYTGSAGWMYRAGIEWILGFRVRGETLSIDPCVPGAWRNYSITYHHRSATYRIFIENPMGVSRGVVSAELDGKSVATSGSAANFPLTDDGSEHSVRVVLG